MKSTVTTCQFPIGSDGREIFGYVEWQIQTAADRGASVEHFPEACRSGYAGVDFASHEAFDWSLLEVSSTWRARPASGWFSGRRTD